MHIRFDKQNMKKLNELFEDLRPAAEESYKQCRVEAEKKLGGPVRLVGDTFSDLSQPPSYIFERLPA